MNNTYVLYAVIVFMAAYFVYTKLSAIWKASAARRAEEVAAAEAKSKATTDAMNALAKALEVGQVNGVDATKLLAGTLKACESIAEATVQFRDEVAAFRKLITSPKETGYPEDNLRPPATEEEANRQADFVAAILKGIPVDQAEQQYKDNEEKKTMVSATDLGMEE